MRSTSDSIKILARRFASLSPQVRIKVGERLLRWREAHAVDHKGPAPCACAPEKNFLEQFWDEVEAAHGDGLYQLNPFADGRRPMALYAPEAQAA